MHNGTIEYTSRDAHQVKLIWDRQNEIVALTSLSRFVCVCIQGVPTMRGDIEILAYNIIQWGGGELPWEKNKLLGTPVKVQQAKDELMSGVDSRLKACFPNQQCPGEISQNKCICFTSFVTICVLKINSLSLLDL